jgi:hypothetical protein
MSVFLIFLVPETLPAHAPDDIVGVDYLVEHTGLAARTIRDGKGGISAIPRARNKPLGWHRRHVDAWLRKRAEKAQKPASRKGLVNRKPRAQTHLRKVS